MPDFGGELSDVGDLALGNASESLHPITINMADGRTIEGLRAPPDAVRQLTNAARDSAGARTGKMPGWYYGK
jgi:hypothetical protein